MNSPLLSTAYLPPVQYFTKILDVPCAYIEAHEHFSKQNYRSRCHILGANGVQILSVPIEKTHGEKMPIRDVRIDYSVRWQQQHWRALVSAYNSSPFFEYYADELFPFFEKQEKFLFDLNYQLLQKITEWIGLSAKIKFTEDYQKNAPCDFRSIISPKPSQFQPDNNFNAAEYYQVFSAKFGFQPNLSIVDLLFNEGNNTQDILIQSSIKTSNPK